VLVSLQINWSLVLLSRQWNWLFCLFLVMKMCNVAVLLCLFFAINLHAVLVSLQWICSFVSVSVGAHFFTPVSFKWNLYAVLISLLFFSLPSNHQVTLNSLLRNHYAVFNYCNEAAMLCLFLCNGTVMFVEFFAMQP